MSVCRCSRGFDRRHKTPEPNAPAGKLNAFNSRRLLTWLAELVIPGAVLAGDLVTPDGRPDTDLRIRYCGLVTPWWPQYNIPASAMAALVAGTGWRIELHEEDGDDHAVLLRRT